MSIFFRNLTNSEKKPIEYNVNEGMVAIEDMMRKKIVMPAHFLREKGMEVGGLR